MHRWPAVSIAAVLSLGLLCSCMTRIPEEVLDAEWCRSLLGALPKADERGRKNLQAAMTKHRCAEKMAADQAGQPATRPKG